MTEIVYINLPGPSEPEPGMIVGEILNGYLAELYKSPSAELKACVSNLCHRWNVHYVEPK
jgi:uncharacterized protein YdbL (DUF1318 family)